MRCAAFSFPGGLTSRGAPSYKEAHPVRKREGRVQDGQVRFGDLSIGPLPRVVGTISSAGFLREELNPARLAADVVELRLDLVGVKAPGWLEAAERWEASGVPVLFTLRTSRQGGACTLGDEERRGYFERALGRVSAVDVEIDSELREWVASEAHARGKGLVVSHHDFAGTPSEDELRELVRRGAANAPCVVKVATVLKTEKDLWRLVLLLAEEPPVPLCVLGMGPIGTRTRVAFPLLGSCLTYGYLDQPNTPGQLPAEILVEQLRLSWPAYDEDYRRRKSDGNLTAGRL